MAGYRIIGRPSTKGSFMSIGCAKLDVRIPNQPVMATAFARCMRTKAEMWDRAVANAAATLNLDATALRGILPDPASGQITFASIPSTIPSTAVRRFASAIMTQLTSVPHIGLSQ